MSRLVLILAMIAASAQQAGAVDFDTQIMPLITKYGCNSGACHGAAAGRGGLRMSLYGSKPAFDFEQLTLELKGRRVNLARPDQSLLLRKPTEWIAHGGGTRFDADSEPGKLLLRWIEEGANRPASTTTLSHLKVTPSVLVAKLDQVATLKATATFSNGDQQDVTRWTIFQPDDPVAVQIENDQATILRRGRHIVSARYLDQLVPIEFVVPLNDSVQGTDSTFGKDATNVVDQHVANRLKVLNLPVSSRADDATMLRRLYVDLTGRLPEPKAIRDFLDDKRPDKSAKLIDALLKSDEFTIYWTYRFSELLRIRTQPQDTQAARTYHAWIRQQIADNVGLDEMVRALINATGDTHEVGPANFYRTVAGAREQAEFVSELFMGMRLRCANCHDHPLDRWTQDDYHGLAAIFAKVKGGRVIEIDPRAEVSHPVTGEAAIPRIPGTAYLTADQDGPKSLADWLASKTNPYFAKAMVNRLWQSVMGTGLIEPTDDLRPTNVATHSELLNALAADFVEHGFDLRRTLRLICNSQTYALSGVAIEANKTDAMFYSHRQPRTMRPEVFVDAICDVTGIPEKYADEPMGTRAVELFAGNLPAQSLDILGRCSREDGCEEPDTARPGNLPRALHLINGPLINGKVATTAGRLPQLVEQSEDVLVGELYLRTLTRPPTPKERDFWVGQLKSAGAASSKSQVAEDFLWSLLTCREFATIR